ncbi:MAG: gamma-glutamyltransferase [Sandaracinaceae bacterium]|nr:gamma-glutamyltransferase [Sandaracinaceae bacterium]
MHARTADRPPHARAHRWLGALALAALFPVLLAQRADGSGAIVFTEHAVAADDARASAAGAEILAAGGNAADAAAATMLALGVVSPASSGLGGGGFALYYRASDRTLHYLDFRERAPAAATADMFARREGDDAETAANRSRAGGLAVGVPGEPAGIAAMLERLGSGRVTRAQVAAPAIRHARQGWETSAVWERFSRWLAEPMRADPVFGRWFPPGSAFIPAGHRVDNPALARTLEEFAARGAEPFYRGRIAREIVARVRAQGGVMTAEDLAAYEVRAREPLVGTHFGHRFVTAPPPSAGGVSLLASLALLERWLPPSHRGQDSAYFRHALAESWKGPYADRQHYLGDPDHVDVPTAALLEPARVEARARTFHPMLAQPTGRFEQPLEGRAHRPAVPGGDAGTSHLCVVDAEGNVAAVTTTVNLPFGARFSAAGMAMNDEMDDFAREVGAPNAFGLVGGAPNLPGPGRRPLSSMTPTIVFEGERPILCAGAAGGSRIITATEQVLLFAILFGDTAGEAMARRRIHHQGAPSTLYYEEGMDDALLEGLRARGHAVASLDHSAVAQMIRIVYGEHGVAQLQAASDPRKGGRPAGR